MRGYNLEESGNKKMFLEIKMTIME